MLWSQNFKKYTNKKIQTGGRAPGAPALDPPLVKTFITEISVCLYTIEISIFSPILNQGGDYSYTARKYLLSLQITEGP